MGCKTVIDRNPTIFVIEFLLLIDTNTDTKASILFSIKQSGISWNISVALFILVAAMCC